MPTKSIEGFLPKDINQALIHRIISPPSHVKDIGTDLVDFLLSKGFKRSRSALHRHSVTIKAKVNRLNTLILSRKLSPYTVAKHLDELETLSELLAKKLILDDEINTLEQIILATEQQGANHEP